MKKSPAQTYNDEEDIKIPSDYIRNKLKLKNFEEKRRLFEKHPHVESFFKFKGINLSKIRERSAHIIGAGALTGTLFLTPPAISLVPTPLEFPRTDEFSGDEFGTPKEILLKKLKRILSKKVGPLGRSEEKNLEKIIFDITGINIKAALEGEHLNTNYGLIGAEQHLKRFPGDVLSKHGQGEILKEGIAPGLGAWGYFTKSEKNFTPYFREIEKWYAVVQTLYLPDWNVRQPYLHDWYKYRKVLILNTENGNVVVAAIADAGPAAWTGKHFGGSPEVMDYLGGRRYKKGPVLLFFVDDPDNIIPLGPVNYDKILLPEQFVQIS